MRVPRPRRRAVLEQVYDWLARADPVGPGDLVFALAGRPSRKLFALSLFFRKLAPVLLLSVGRFEIRRFAQLPWPVPLDLLAIAAPVPPPQRLYFVGFEAGKSTVERVERGKFGTLSEIRGLARWLQQRPEIDSLLIVTSATHLRRVRMCCRAILPSQLATRFVAVPEETPFLNRDNWWRNRRSRTMVLAEFPKLLLYRTILSLPGGRPKVLTSDLNRWTT